MKRIILKSTFIICFLFLFLSSGLRAQFELDELKINPQLGLWFGPVLPFPNTALSEVLVTNLGGGLFSRINLPSKTFRTEIGTSLSYYRSNATEALLSIPNYVAISYSMPIDSPLLLQGKIGVGSNYLRSLPEKNHNWLPAFFLGFEMSFPAGRVVNIGLRIDYYFVIETIGNQAPSENPNFALHNGHFINIGLMLNFNLNP